MAGKSDAFEYNFLKQTFNGTPITNVTSSGGTTSIWMAMCTADPGEAGSTAAEGGYPAYARTLTDRSTASNGWAITSGTSAATASASPVGNVDFPQVATTSTGTFTHFVAYPSSASIASAALYFGTITPNINFSQNVIPRLTTGSSITED
jgi:hypothetical protein